MRNLIDQQLWLSKGKELGITGETELVKQLDEIRKKYNLETMEDLEKAAREQGVSYEDFKANIRNQIITQQVMRDQVGRRVSVTPGEVQRYFEAHKQDYAQPESVHLSEILVSTGADANDEQKLATAKAKADDIAAKLKAGEDFAKLARSSSDGPTAAQGGDLGKFGPGSLAKVLEDQTFSLKAGEFTQPIRTKQGYVILKVDEHVSGGTPAVQRRRATSGREFLHEPDGAGNARLPHHDARRGVHRHQARLCRYRREFKADQAHLQRLHAPVGQEKEEGAAHAFPRNGTRLSQQSCTARGGSRFGGYYCCRCPSYRSD